MGLAGPTFMRKRPSISVLLLLLLSAPISEPAHAEQVHGFTLPDDGPRYETPVKGPDGTLFTQGLTAFQNGRPHEAERAFTTLSQKFPDSPLVSAVRAFVADLGAKDGSDHDRRQAIEAYRALIRDDPSSANALRARWRIGDLYVQGRWLIEAKATYEQALAESPAEAPRALFGLGLVFLDGAQWKDAEYAFQQVMARTEDERLIVPATFGLAEALARAKHWDRAEAVYETGIRRWPTALRLLPESMLLFADVNVHLHKRAEARSLLEQFYNLYPRHSEAPSALLRIGDSWRQMARPDRAKTLYAEVIQKHSGTFHESVARMRLGELARDRFVQGPRPGPELGVETLLEGRPALDADAREQETMFEQIAQAYAGVELGSEALFHLGEYLEAQDRRLEAVNIYRRAGDRKGLIADDPWPSAAGWRLVAILGPWMVAALQAHDDLAAVSLFYRHGAFGEDLYAGNAILLLLAEAHQRLGFSPQAVKLYQVLVRETAPEDLRENALVGLGLAYLDQEDLPAARRVFERALLQYPAGQSRARALAHLAETLHRQGEWNGVIRVSRLWLRHATVQATSEGRRMLHLLAHAQVETGHAREALDTLARAVSAGHTTGDMGMRYADRLLAAGQYGPAATRYVQTLHAPQSTSDAEWARLQLAKIRRAQKRYGEARALLREVQSMTTDDLVGRISAALMADLPETRKPAGG
jgi:TolA-binding protein